MFRIDSEKTMDKKIKKAHMKLDTVVSNIDQTLLCMKSVTRLINGLERWKKNLIKR
jgi:hypothetical protein